MSAFSCPKCNGKCCRDVVYGHHRTHWAANEYAHDCAFCHDGTVPVWTAAEERASIVAMLREYSVPRQHDPDVLVLLPPGATIVSDFADSIERGDHITGAKP